MLYDNIASTGWYIVCFTSGMYSHVDAAPPKQFQNRDLASGFASLSPAIKIHPNSTQTNFATCCGSHKIKTSTSGNPHPKKISTIFFSLKIHSSKLEKEGGRKSAIFHDYIHTVNVLQFSSMQYHFFPSRFHFVTFISNFTPSILKSRLRVCSAQPMLGLLFRRPLQGGREDEDRGT